MEQPITPAPQPEVPQESVTADPAMASVLNTLEQQTQVAAPVAAPEVAPAPVVGQPVIPNPQF